MRSVSAVLASSLHCDVAQVGVSSLGILCEGTQNHAGDLVVVLFFLPVSGCLVFPRLVFEFGACTWHGRYK